MPIAGQLKTAYLAASGQAIATGTKCAVTAIHYRSTGTVGEVELLDGGSGGTSKMKVSTPAVAMAIGFPFVGGLHFEDGVYVALTNSGPITIMYQVE